MIKTIIHFKKSIGNTTERYDLVLWGKMKTGAWQLPQEI